MEDFASFQGNVTLAIHDFAGLEKLVVRNCLTVRILPKAIFNSKVDKIAFLNIESLIIESKAFHLNTRVHQRFRLKMSGVRIDNLPTDMLYFEDSPVSAYPPRIQVDIDQCTIGSLSYNVFGKTMIHNLTMTNNNIKDIKSFFIENNVDGILHLEGNHIRMAQREAFHVLKEKFLAKHLILSNNVFDSEYIHINH